MNNKIMKLFNNQKQPKQKSMLDNGPPNYSHHQCPTESSFVNQPSFCDYTHMNHQYYSNGLIQQNNTQYPVSLYAQQHQNQVQHTQHHPPSHPTPVHHHQHQHQHHQQQQHPLPLATMSIAATCSCHSSASLQQPTAIPHCQVQNSFLFKNDTLDTGNRLAAEQPVATANLLPQMAGPVHSVQPAFSSPPGSAACQPGPIMPMMQTNGHQQQPQQQLSARYYDNNSYYSNQPLDWGATQQQQQAQRNLQPTSQSSQPFPQYQQKSSSNSNNINNTSNYSNGQQLDEQKCRPQSHQLNGHQPVEQQQSFKQDPHQAQQQPNLQIQQLANNVSNQMNINHQLPQQQQYQNQAELSNDNSEELPLEASCTMYEGDYEELQKLAGKLRGEIEELNYELKAIRRETPKYSIAIEEKI